MKKLFFNKQIIITILIFSFFLIFPKRNAFAVINYQNGYYTNLCGTGTSATANTCNAGCNTSTGRCSASENFVVKFTCDGKQTECLSNESSFSTSQTLSGTACNKTVQIDVFDKTCRVNGEWICGDGSMKDYIVWYSGDCPSPTPTRTPTPTRRPTNTPRPTATPRVSATPKPTKTPAPTPAPDHKSLCTNLEVTGGNDSLVPAKVTLKASAYDNQGSIQKYRFYFGDGQRLETTDPEATHTYESSGFFTASVEIKDSIGNWKTNSSCKTKVKVNSSTLESHKSDCSDVRIVEGNYQQAPSLVKYEISGYDNKGGIKKYKLDFGNGIVKESDSSNFEQIYTESGTFTVKAYIQDSTGEWKGGEKGCKNSVHVSTKPLEKQPKTGTPTLFSILGLSSGIAGFSLKKLKLKK